MPPSTETIAWEALRGCQKRYTELLEQQLQLEALTAPQLRAMYRKGMAELQLAAGEVAAAKERVAAAQAAVTRARERAAQGARRRCTAALHCSGT